jgi:hypothetical protein
MANFDEARWRQIAQQKFNEELEKQLNIIRGSHGAEREELSVTINHCCCCCCCP